MSNYDSITRTVISQIMLPNQANVAGNVHGGEIMKIMDSTAYATARRYARANVVTARVDELEFHKPIMIGDLLICTADITFVGRSSMEVMVRVDVEDLENESGPQEALSAYFTIVALDRNMKPQAIPALSPTTSEKKALFIEGQQRYERYKALKKEKKAQKNAKFLDEQNLAG